MSRATRKHTQNVNQVLVGRSDVVAKCPVALSAPNDLADSAAPSAEERERERTATVIYAYKEFLEFRFLPHLTGEDRARVNDTAVAVTRV